MSRSTRKKEVGVALFLLYASVIGIGSAFPPYAKTADLVLVSAYLLLMVFFPVTTVREKLREWNNLQPRPDILYRWRRWVSDAD